MSIKMAIIGMGNMAGWHYKLIKECIPGLIVTGGYDIQKEARDKASEWGITNYNSPTELYEDKNIDLVLVATPNDKHKEYSINCLLAGKHVVCEKPVTLNAAELEEIIVASEKSGKIFTINQNRRWDKDYLIIRKILSDGLLNNPYNIESRVQGSRRPWGWRAFKQNGGGMLLDWGVHLLDQILDLIPQKVVSVYGHLHKISNGDVDDCLTTLLRFENGCTAEVNVSTNCFITQPRWHLSCEDGTAVIKDWELGGSIVKLVNPKIMDWEDAIVYTSAGPTHTMIPRPKETTQELQLPETSGDWSDFYINIVDAINGKAKPIVTATQALRVMKVIDAIFESDLSGAAITTHI